MTAQISELRHQPQFFDSVADRIWQAWWNPGGYSLEYVSNFLSEMIKGERVPFAIVAHDGDEFIGSALAVASAMDTRPQYSPWVAAVWVEPQARLKQVGRTLVGHATHMLFQRGFARVYICSVPELLTFYTRQGWQPIEHDVGERHQTVYIMDAPGELGLKRD